MRSGGSRRKGVRAPEIIIRPPSFGESEWNIYTHMTYATYHELPTVNWLPRWQRAAKQVTVINWQQIQAGRVLMGWTAKELADKARLSVSTILRAESEKRVTEGNLYLIQRAFEEAGLVFLDVGQASPGGGRGIRFRE